MTTHLKRVLVGAVVALAFGACGDDGGSSATTTSPSSTTAVATTTTVAGLEQPAIWPKADVYFATPDAAAKDFVEKVLKVPAVLGAFRQGDTRSGEVQVFSQPEGSTTKAERGVLLLRQLGARDGWFVLGAVNANATIASPTQAAKVPAGSLTVSGKARGFEANVVVSAYLAGDAARLDFEVTQGGSMETPRPYSVTLDVPDASSGDTMMLLVRGGTGLETDPGEFGAIAVVVE